MHFETFTVQSWAKINLGLSVTGRRPDGYHNLDTVFCELKVGDTLTFSAAAGLTLEVVGANLPTDQGNLVYRAAQAFFEAAHIAPQVHIVLHKKLPLAAGLGGGSSNAAYTLSSLQRIFGTQLNLHPIARALGADVPFFLQGGCAHAGGIGDQLQPLPMPNLHVVLVNPNIAISAASAYGGLAPYGYNTPLEVPALLQSLNAAQPLYFNTLEGPVEALYPQISQLKQAMRQAGLRGVLMSGSGSTCFGLANSAQQGQAIAQSLASWGWSAYSATA